MRKVCEALRDHTKDLIKAKTLSAQVLQKRLLDTRVLDPHRVR
jgi:hypothetical protein